jgi:integrase
MDFLFRYSPIPKTDRPLTHGAVYHRILRKHAKAAGIDFGSFGPHALRATAATNALDRGADLGKVQEWLGHANRVDYAALRPAAFPPRDVLWFTTGILGEVIDMGKFG